MPVPHVRQRLIRLIHVGKRDLSLDDDTYRAILQRFGGKSSSAELTVAELETVLEHLRQSGFQIRTKTGSRKAMPSRPLAQDAESRKIRALWLFLHEIGVVKNPSEAALAAYVKRMAGVDALQWLNSEQSERLIEAMKKWAMRLLPNALETLAQRAAELVLSDIDRAQLDSALTKAFSRRTFDPMHAAWEQLNDALRKDGEHHV